MDNRKTKNKYREAVTLPALPSLLPSPNPRPFRFLSIPPISRPLSVRVRHRWWSTNMRNSLCYQSTAPEIGHHIQPINKLNGFANFFCFVCSSLHPVWFPFDRFLFDSCFCFCFCCWNRPKRRSFNHLLSYKSLRIFIRTARMLAVFFGRKIQNPSSRVRAFENTHVL